MTGDISIKYDGDGTVTNRYIGAHDGEGWTLTKSADWPDPTPADNEIPIYFYDAQSGDITVEYEIVEPPQDTV